MYLSQARRLIYFYFEDGFSVPFDDDIIAHDENNSKCHGLQSTNTTFESSAGSAEI